MSRKNHKMIDGRLLQTNKKYSQLKMKQKEKIAEWMFQAIREYYMKKCTFPNDKLHHPELAGKPMAASGDPEARHGIVLTANYIAKRAGVKTGMALWQARQVCQEIIFVPPRMDLYLRFSRMAQEIYSEYTDQREPFGIDESWLDVTASTSI